MLQGPFENGQKIYNNELVTVSPTTRLEFDPKEIYLCLVNRPQRRPESVINVTFSIGSGMHTEWFKWPSQTTRLA